MTKSIEDLLRAIEPSEPQLDWRQLWLEQGRAQGRQERVSRHWASHPAWAGVGIVSTCASLLLSVIVLVQYNGQPHTWNVAPPNMAETPNPGPMNPENIASDAQGGPASDVAPSVASGTSQDTVSPGVSPRRREVAWVSPWPGFELAPEWKRRQQLLQQGVEGLDAFLATERTPTGSARRLQPQTDLLWNGMINPESTLPDTSTKKPFRIGDWL